MRSFYFTPVGGFSRLRIVTMLVLAAGLTACGSAEKPQQKPQPTPVDVMSVQPQTVDIMAEYPGRVQGKREVQVLARVEGILEKRHYEEGQIVQKGDLLVSIDQKPFLAVGKQRKAELASARASLNQARRNWNRAKQLYQVDAISEAERDDALSKVETSRAAVQQAQANLEAAQINIGYTRVNAPLTGVTSLEETEEGALVSNGTRLTTITQLDPVDVLFSLPEDDALARSKALAAMGKDDGLTREATIVLPSGEDYATKGRVDFTQSTIDPDTGTVRMRASVDNSNNGLAPGRFVRVRIRLETRDSAIVIPEVAISDGQQDPQVYVLGDDNKAQAAPVKLGPSVAGGRLIKSGLSAGDRVIVSGLGQIKPGAPVKVKQGQEKSSGNSGAGGPGKSPQSGAKSSGDAESETLARDGAGTDGRRSEVAGIERPSLRLRPAELSQHADHAADNAYAVNADRGR